MPANTTGAVRRQWRSPVPLVPAVVLGAHIRSRAFPTFRVVGVGGTAEVWWATQGQGEPCTARFTVDARSSAVTLDAWGPGAPWCADRMPVILGAGDRATGFDPTPLLASPFDRVHQAWRQHGALPTPATGAVLETLALAILEQRVTGIESMRSWTALVRAYGEPAPGPSGVVPPGMYLPPSAASWQRIPSWAWHQAGVDGTRARTLISAAQRSDALNRLVDRDPSQARSALTSLPGIGPWTAAEVSQRALGDADAVSVGDYHLGATVVHALTGATGGTDERMLELLEPSRPHRYRIVRICELSGAVQPRRGPRASITDHRRR